MIMSGLKCSASECKKRLEEVKDMPFEELEKYNTKCASCGEWIIKDEKFANQTYDAISNRWAEQFMNNLIHKK